MLRKLLTLCQGRLAPAAAHAPQIFLPKIAAFILSFRRQTASVLGHSLQKLAGAKPAFARERKHYDDLPDLIVRHAPEGVFVVDGDLQFIEVNDGFCRIWGLNRKEILAQSLPELFAEADCEQDFFSDLLVRSACRGEMTIATRTGAACVVEVETEALPRGCYMGFVRDITEKKHYENELRRAAEWRALLLRSFSEGLALIDCDGRILLCNRAFEVALGLSAACLQEISLLSPVRENGSRHTWSLGNERSAAVYGAENPFYCALRWQQRSEEHRLQVFPSHKLLAVNATPLCDERNQLLGAVATVRDITASATKEREQQAEFFLQQQIRCLAAQRRFAGDIVRQIEEPASGIALYAQLMQDNLATANERAVLVRGIQQETNGLLETVRELKALAHAVRNGTKVSLVDENAAEFVNMDHMFEAASLPQEAS